MITFTITVEEKDGQIKTLMDSKTDNPTVSEVRMASFVEGDFKKRQKKLARQTGGKFVSG